MFIAWHMGEWSKLFYLRKFRWPYRATLLSVFFLTVLIDLTIAIEVGLLCAFVTLIYRIASLSKVHAIKASQYSQLQGQSGIVDAYTISGAVFFGTTYLLNEIEQHLPSKSLVLDFHKVLYTDTSGMDALQELGNACREAQVRLILCGLNAQVFDLIKRLDFIKPGLQNQICTTLEEGITEGLKNSFDTPKGTT
jgi:SulP family sulfate permease